MASQGSGRVVEIVSNGSRRVTGSIALRHSTARSDRWNTLRNRCSLICLDLVATHESFDEKGRHHIRETLERGQGSAQLHVLELDRDVRIGRIVSAADVGDPDLLTAVEPKGVLAMSAQVAMAEFVRTSR